MQRLIVFAIILLVPFACANAEPLALHTVTVDGTATILVAPDEATIDIGVVSSNATASAALRVNNAEMARVVKAIRDQGVADANIETSSFSIDPVHPEGKNGSYDYSKTVGYEVTNKVTVVVDDLSKVANVIDAAVSAGANASNSVSFGVKDRTTYVKAAERTAMHNARERAELLVGEENKKVGELLAVSIGYPSRVTAVGQQEMKFEGTPVTSILPEKVSISAELTAQFAIE